MQEVKDEARKEKEHLEGKCKEILLQKSELEASSQIVKE